MNFCLLGVIKDITLPYGAIMLRVFFKLILFELLIVKLRNKGHRRDLSKCCVFNTDIHHTLKRKHRPNELSSACLLSKDKCLNNLVEHSRKSLTYVVFNVPVYTLKHGWCYNKLYVYHCVLAMLMAFQILERCPWSGSALQQPRICGSPRQTRPGLSPWCLHMYRFCHFGAQ